MRRLFISRVVAAALALAALPACPEDDDDRATVDHDTDESSDEGQPESSPEVAVDERALEALEALGYIDRTTADNPEDRGVTTNVDDDANGLNLYGSRDRAEALLVDMEGEVVHRWESEREEAWMHAEPIGDGALLTITRDVALSKFDWNSEEVWRTPLAAHHDLAVTEDGRALALVRGRTTLSHGGETLPVLCDSIAVVSPDGDVQARHPLLPLFRHVVEGRRIASITRRLAEGRSPNELLRPGGVADVLHTNSIAILRREIEGVAPAGALLLSFRASSRIAILSPTYDEVLWTWGRGELDGQHDATQLANGNLLAFDNGLRRGERSRVVEVDPTQGEVVWTYAPPDLYTRLRGGAQGLSNGNVLVTESDKGHALEVSREGEVVWEFWNPDVRGTRRATIYRLNRYATSLFPALDER